MLVDAITEHDPGRRLVAVKNVTVNEEYFQGHFPGAPLLPAVLMLETLTQVAAILILERDGRRPNQHVYLRGVNDAKFRRQVVPGDRLRLQVSLGARRSSVVRAQAAAYVEDQVVAEAELVLVVQSDRALIDPSAIVDHRAEIGEGTTVGPHVMIITPHNEDLEKFSHDGSNGQPYVAHLSGHSELYLVMPFKDFSTQ